jgi:uncharacterized membrane protein
VLLAFDNFDKKPKTDNIKLRQLFILNHFKLRRVMETPEKSSGSTSNKTAMAVIAYFIFFIPLLTEDKNDPFVKYHVKQGLTTTIFFVILGVLEGILFVPLFFIFWIWWIIWVLLVILWIIGIINAASGKQEPVPVIGKIGEGFKF